MCRQLANYDAALLMLMHIVRLNTPPEAYKDTGVSNIRAALGSRFSHGTGINLVRRSDTVGVLNWKYRPAVHFAAESRRPMKRLCQVLAILELLAGLQSTVATELRPRSGFYCGFTVPTSKH